MKEKFGSFASFLHKLFIYKGMIRNDVVETAVKFLTSDKVKKAPRSSQLEFLQKKGLSDEEIEESFRRVKSVSPSSKQNITIKTEQSFSWKTMFISMAIGAAVTAGLYQVGKRFLANFFMKEDQLIAEEIQQLKKQLQSIDNLCSTFSEQANKSKELVEKLESSLVEIDHLQGSSELVQSIKCDLDELTKSVPELVEQVKTSQSSVSAEFSLEMKSLKSLIVSGKDLPVDEALPTSIPSWQQE